MLTTTETEAATVVRLDHGKVNALDAELCRAVAAEFTRLAAREPKPVVLTGNDRAFSAGIDLARVLSGGPAYTGELLDGLSAAVRAVFEFPHPVVAAVNGHAIAGGLVLAAAADVRLMSGGSAGLVELAVGVPFPVAALEVMRHVLGSRTTSVVLGGRYLDPREAERLGLVDQVVTPDALLTESLAVAARLGAVPGPVYTTTKRQLRRPAVERIEADAATGPLIAGLWNTPEVREAVRHHASAHLGARRSTTTAT
ncbi:enoyl-CoA hydratase/isomerase family protein [Streptomyces sp. J2-1]|uniref:enoyl-CoA hydratase/isomerase family protein n=1 Tax=Streptomyces corallincola TaxID=2851888 RepID=UPI001C38BF0E|nr:enoyl-CoA hydratase/isomerase family protein [Streptomyces corallincola]MBV2353676.1 enoyl-CoA hydratase/isomerase family protein [Streptomyces corallincola]